MSYFTLQLRQIGSVFEMSRQSNFRNRAFVRGVGGDGAAVDAGFLQTDEELRISLGRSGCGNHNVSAAAVVIPKAVVRGS